MRCPLAVLRRFVRSEFGAGTVFYLALVPVFMALAGLAIDAAMVYRTRAALQSAADAASLAAALDLPSKQSSAATDAIKYAEKNLPPASNGEVLVAADVFTGNWNPDTGVFTVGGTPLNAARVITRRAVSNSNAMPTTFLRLIGIDHWDVSAAAISTSDQPKMWVGLALDNTGSMCEPDSSPCPGDTNPNIKINALKTASHQLMNLLQGAAVHDGDIQVAVVPFARDVNIGTASAAASWLEFTDFSMAALPVPGSNVGPGKDCPWNKTNNGFQCQSTPVNDPNSYNAWTNPSVPSSGTYKGYICPSLDSVGHYYNGCYDSETLTTDRYGNPTSWKHVWLPNSTATWDGCVTDRKQDYDTAIQTPLASAPDTLFPADNAPACPVATVLPLTYNWTALNAKIDTMSAAGSTNQTIGFVWAWQALQQGNPLNAPVLPPRTKRIIILLSDGLNTQDRWYGDGRNQSTDVDARMELACDHAKTAGVEIFTVFVDLSGTNGNSAPLLYCASGSDHYFPLTTSGQIITTFAEIGRRITALRIVD